MIIIIISDQLTLLWKIFTLFSYKNLNIHSTIWKSSCANNFGHLLTTFECLQHIEFIIEIKCCLEYNLLWTYWARRTSDPLPLLPVEEHFHNQSLVHCQLMFGIFWWVNIQACVGLVLVNIFSNISIPFVFLVKLSSINPNSWIKIQTYELYIFIIANSTNNKWSSRLQFKDSFNIKLIYDKYNFIAELHILILTLSKDRHATNEGGL